MLLNFITKIQVSIRFGFEIRVWWDMDSDEWVRVDVDEYNFDFTNQNVTQGADTKTRTDQK